MQPMVHNLKTLLTIAPWLQPDQSSNLISLVRTLVAEKMPEATLEALLPLRDTIVGGIPTHRLSDVASPKGSYLNGTANSASWVTIITDTATKFAKSTLDRNIMWQSIMTVVLGQVGHLFRDGAVLSPYYAATLDCDTCTAPCYEGHFELSRPPDYTPTPIYLPVTEIHSLVPVTSPESATVPCLQALAAYTAWKVTKGLITWHVHALAPDQGPRGELPMGPLNLTELRITPLKHLFAYMALYLWAHLSFSSRKLSGSSRGFILAEWSESPYV